MSLLQRTICWPFHTEILQKYASQLRHVIVSVLIFAVMRELPNRFLQNMIFEDLIFVNNEVHFLIKQDKNKSPEKETYKRLCIHAKRS